MRLNKLLLVGAVFVLIGVIGAVLTFSNLTPTDGQTFVDQIDISTGVDKFQDYEVGDEVIIVDEIVRMEENDDGNTHVWLESIADKNIFFIFKSNIMDDYGIGSNIKITFTVVQDSEGHDTPDGYQNSPPGLSPDSITDAYGQTFFFISITIIISGIGMALFGIITSGTSIVQINRQPSADDWGMPAAPPAAAPPMASMPQPMAPPPAAGAPPSMAAIPEPSAPPPPANLPSTMTITVPPGVVPGQVLTVTMPSGQVVNVQVPSGSTPGSQFTITVQQ